VTFDYKNGGFKRRKYCIVERENAFFKSSPLDEYHLPQMNSEKVFFWVHSIMVRKYRMAENLACFHVSKLFIAKNMANLWPILCTSHLVILRKKN
jgi:hypothetical protein